MELNDWLEDWTARRQEATAELVTALEWEHSDMLARHNPWNGRHLDPPAPPPVAATSVATPSVDRGMGAGVEQWRGLVSGYGWNPDIALCLMGYESGGNPNAYNSSSGASGLMQVLSSWADNFGVSKAALFDPTTNLNISYALYADGGWGHWAPWNRGECH